MKTTKAQDKRHKEFYEKLGARIVMLRLEKNLSQERLAHNCGWDTPNLRRIEKGRQNPSLRTLLILCEGLDISLSELLDF